MERGDRIRGLGTSESVRMITPVTGARRSSGRSVLVRQGGWRAGGPPAWPVVAGTAPDRGCPVAGSGCPGSRCFGFSRAVRGPGDPVCSGFELGIFV